MATVITCECINCGACEPECPSTAIYQGGVESELNGVKGAPMATDVFYIVPEKCTECVGFYDYEACAAVCPVDCCVPDPNNPETEEVLIARAKQLLPDRMFGDGFPSRFRKEGGATAVPEAAEAPALPAIPAAP
jgi:ferredoxin